MASIFKKFVIYLGFMLPFLLILSLIIIAPYLSASGQSVYSFIIYSAFSLVCHQMPERSFFVFGHKLAVCARCTGMYSGFVIAAILFPLFRGIDCEEIPNPWFLIISLIPMALDGGIQLITDYESNNMLRFITGLIFGYTSIFYLLPIYNQIIYGIRINSSD
ncbi:MAG: DUF2085 domain-containing protein [Candidatus Altiarchaeales archaeon]|nr:MAG: DUF2085 domain-containing protein [Candidatus Altiarchaeales archaeon]RLI93886.1 MAG: DUF2085 domain-containing protein [Candidatus Altiarchaeales archaeon]RLI93908.1 MAG: DUF2085 domain-containing protein [Candidatus Altiarchaeales archaeon]HDO82076.1 DUF2085 domain-containing protein [Candidatus Altiarchaeales archaeon]HEX54725.1 DUF2085 domain-containing protein [Candidatus Altiarchaeales archaeon]